jgi:hypothetical protein
LSKRLSYNAIRIPIVGVIALSIALTLAIIPAAVSSPGIADRIENQLMITRSPSAVETENGSFSQVNVDAPLPFLRKDAAANFNALRKAVIAGAGFDFLAKVGDMLRASNSKPVKVGAVFNSRHKKGEAFDYNQEDPRVMLVREYAEGRLHWRTYLLCQTQTGRLGIKLRLHTDNAGLVSAYVFDFTAAAEKFGWERIPAQAGWSTGPTKKEFWHYQYRATPQPARPSLDHGDVSPR